MDARMTGMTRLRRALSVPVVALYFLSGIVAVPAAAETAAPATTEETAPKIRELLNLLADPGVQSWLQGQKGAAALAPATPAGRESSASPMGMMGSHLDALRRHVAGLVQALPGLPEEIRGVGSTLMAEFMEHGLLPVLLLIAGFVALGYGVEWLYYWLFARVERRIAALPLDTVEERLRAVGIRLAYGIGMILAFTIGSVGAFLLFHWPPLLREIVLGYLVAFLALRLALVAGRFVLSPGGERFRILPMPTPNARFWLRRVAWFVGWFAYGWITVSLLGTLGFSDDGRRLVAYALGLGLLAIGIEAVWRRPRAPAEPAVVAMKRRWADMVAWLYSAYFVLLWALWVVHAVRAFWLAAVAVGLPLAIRLTRRAVNHILRPAGAASISDGPPTLHAICLERGLRVLLIVGAVALIARAWGVGLADMAVGASLETRLLKGALSAVVIVLIAEFGWAVARAAIDRKLAQAQAAGGLAGGDEARRRARLLTLLPIFKNMLLVVLIVMVVLMALSSMGVEIGPLIAGAGVVGVAIGFGAQTLVKDIISGMFYLLDDAFRVGEYIQSGSYKGVVESFSLRSVKLRHHRGPLFTVPFGELGAIQNMSRDWVIDKLTIGVTFGTDLDKAKKLIKQIGKELQENPDFAPHIIETLKMQGVEQFGDYAIRIRMKMMTKPGRQFVIRRRAYTLIKKAFDANGIRFAQPTVQVAGGEEASSAAVAQKTLELIQTPPAASSS